MLQELAKLSASEVPSVLNIVFKLTDYLNQLWSLFMVFSTIVVGWRFSAKEPWLRRQKIIVTVLYCCFLFVNLMVLVKTYAWLDKALADLRAAAVSLDAQAPRLKEAMTSVDIPGGQCLELSIYGVGAACVLVSIWLNYTAARPARKWKRLRA